MIRSKTVEAKELEEIKKIEQGKEGFEKKIVETWAALVLLPETIMEPW